MVAAWRKAKKEEKRSLLSSRQQISSYRTPKKKQGIFAKNHERTPPLTHGEDDEDYNFKYDVAIVASEYDPSQSFGMSAPKPAARYPSTPMRRVEFKPNKAPPIFTPPPPLVEEEVLANAARMAGTGGSTPPPGEFPSLYSQTLKFIDGICKVPTPQDKGGPYVNPEWGTVPSGDESAYGRSFQTSTNEGTEGITEYSRSVAKDQLEDDPLQSHDETIEHENYEVVLDTADLAVNSTPSPQQKDEKRSMVKRLFSGRKKEKVAQDATPRGEAFALPKAVSFEEQYEEPEIQDDSAIVSESEPWEDRPAQHEREIAVTLVPPTIEQSSSLLSARNRSSSVPRAVQRSRSPVEDVLDALGNVFNYCTEEEKKEELDQIVKRSFDEYDEIGPDDEVEANMTPSNSFAEGEAQSVNGSSIMPAQNETAKEGKGKAKRALTLGVLAMRITNKKKSKKEKPLWLPAVDRKSGRTYWYNRITRESTFRPPPEAVEPKKQLDILESVDEVPNESKALPPQPRGGMGTMIKPVGMTKTDKATKPPKNTKPAGSLLKAVPIQKTKKSKKEKPLWVQAVDRTTGRTYWYNRITRESTFQPPSDAVEPKSELDVAKPREQEAESVAETSEAAKELPKGKPLWKTAVDPESGATYWYNRVTRESTYDPPPEALAQITEAPIPHLNEEPEPVVEVSGAPKANPKSKPLWKSTVDPQSGLTYWYNRITRESTYSPPPEALQQEIGVDPAVPQDENINPESTSEVQQEAQCDPKEAPTTTPVASPEGPADPPTTKKSKKPLWRGVVDESTGRTYYYHRKTGETTWKMPQELKELREAERSVLPDAAQAHAEGDVAGKGVNESPPLEVEAEVSDESKARIAKGEQGLLDNSYEREETGEEDDAFEQASTDENPFDEPIVNVGDIPMHRSAASMNTRSATLLSKASATTKSSVKTDKTQRISNTNPLSNSRTVEVISETMSTATSISSDHDEVRLNTPDRASVAMRSRELKVEELSRSRIAAETYDRSGRVLYGQFNSTGEDAEEGSYYGDNEVDTYGDDSVSAMSENDADFSQRKENFEQARRRALDDAIDREDWDLAAALSEGMRAATSTGDYTKAHESWNQSDLDKFIAANDWDAVKSYIARMREAKKASREEEPPPITTCFSGASEPTVRMATSSRNMTTDAPTTESGSIAYEKMIGSRSQAQHDRIQLKEASQGTASSESGESTGLSRVLDEETYDSHDS